MISDEKQKRITVILESLSVNEKDGLRNICHAIQLKHPTVSQGVLLNEIGQDQANKILVSSTPDVKKLLPSVVTPTPDVKTILPSVVTQTLTQTASVVVSNGQLILHLPHGISVMSSALRLGNGAGRGDGESGGEEDEEEAMDRSRSPSPQHHIFSGPIIK